MIDNSPDEEDRSLRGPFGSADGAIDGEQGFITFQDHGSWGDLEFSSKSVRERIFVGRRGSGKSRYLREYERIARQRMLVFPQQTDTIKLQPLRMLHKAVAEPALREELWIDLWHAATCIALGTFLLSRPDGEVPLPYPSRAELEDIVMRQIGSISAPISVVAALNQILTSTDVSYSKLRGKLSSNDWNVIENIVLRASSAMRPIALFIDTLDENLEYAPAESIDAQCALLIYITRKLIDPNVSNRVHICVTVRDIVVSKLRDHQHFERYYSDLHWKRLDWTKSAARYFFRTKISMLPSNLMKGPPNASSLFERWLGVSSVPNTARGVDEDVEEFILRHTRYLPREIVEIGNAICSEIRASAGNLVKENVWSAVIRIAEEHGRRAIEVVIDHILALSAEDFVSIEVRAGYRTRVRDALTAALRTARNEIFQEPQRLAIDNTFRQSILEPNSTVCLSDILWVHGLVGYLHLDETRPPHRSITIFNTTGSEGPVAGMRLPHAASYRLHATLLSIAKVEIEKSAPYIGTNE
ncbi:MAG: hypothetical protein HXY21_14225 [Parvularculaceae bacterium]|nr:hypothetical protein [Parvularculaceae bacterium]